MVNILKAGLRVSDMEKIREIITAAFPEGWLEASFPRK